MQSVSQQPAADTSGARSGTHAGRQQHPSYTGKLESSGLTYAADLAMEFADREEVRNALWDIDYVLAANNFYIQDLKDKRQQLKSWLAEHDVLSEACPTDASISLLSKGSADQQPGNVSGKFKGLAGDTAEASLAGLDVLPDATTVPVVTGGTCYLAGINGPGKCHFSDKEKKFAKRDPDPTYHLLAAARVGCCSCICELLKQGLSVHSTTKTDGWNVWDQAHFYGKADQHLLSCIDKAGGRASDTYMAYLSKQSIKSRSSATL